METKDIILITVSVVSTITAVTALFFAIIQYKKTQKLEQEKFAWERQRQEKKEREKKFHQLKTIKGKTSDRDIYCEHIIQKFKYLDFTGLNAILQKPLLLEQIYVKLRARESFPPGHYQAAAGFKELDEEKSGAGAEEFITVFKNLREVYSKKGEPLRLVILGRPGSGKTTMMKWIALQCARESDPMPAQFTPVFITLKKTGQVPGKTFRSKNIMDLTHDLLKSENTSPSFLDEQFKNDRILFLLDGLDEVADEELRKEVIQWIQNQNIRKNTLLVTSRSSALQEAKGLKFHDAIPVFTIQDFDISDIEGFLENWYKNIEVAVIGETGEKDKKQAIEKGKSRCEDLINIIKDKSYIHLRQLAVNPLLLTIIAIVHRTRAILPKERHKLYGECLKVMTQLWHVANKNLEIAFSFENSMDNLSRIAFSLMKDNRRELELAEIQSILPQKIERHPLDSFLKEMILKSGLLYESEGKYGFLHLTFQEYLAAWHFARGENQNAVLEYRDKDYWNETFKLLVNIGNPRQFFNEIIDNLEEKSYWQQMQSWDDCLDDVVVEKAREEMEIKSAQKILKILPGIEYKKENEAFIIQLYAHYPLYKHAHRFTGDGWNLFHHARHPFVRSVGSSILNKAGKDIRAPLIEKIKERIDNFENMDHKNHDQMLDFIHQDNNSFVLLIAGRKNLCDFHFVLLKLKSPDLFIRYLCVRYLLDLRDLRDLLDLRDPRDLHDLRYLRDLRDLRDLRNLRYFRYLRDLRYLRYLRDFLDLRGLHHLLGLGYLHDLRGLRYLRNFRDLRILCNLDRLRDLRDQYIDKYETIFKKHKKKIDAWVENVIARLKAFPDKELLRYFPGTSEEEIKIFRTSC